jgi:hypothetical protein
MPTACRYDIGVMTGCRDDIEEYCAEEKTKLRGNATVLRCLVQNFDKTGAQDGGCICCSSAANESCRRCDRGVGAIVGQLAHAFVAGRSCVCSQPAGLRIAASLPLTLLLRLCCCRRLLPE